MQNVLPQALSFVEWDQRHLEQQAIDAVERGLRAIEHVPFVVLSIDLEKCPVPWLHVVAEHVVKAIDVGLDCIDIAGFGGRVRMRRQQIQDRRGNRISRDIDTDRPLFIAQSYSRMDDDILIADKTISELSVRVGQWLEAHDLITIASRTDRSCDLASIRADVEYDVDAVFQPVSYTHLRAHET